MQPHWMQMTPCIVAQWIPIVFSAVDAVRPNASRLNAVDYMQHGQKHPDWRQWIPCSMIECTGFLQHEWMQWIFCSMAPSIPIECSGFHAASLNAVDSMHCDGMQYNPCSMVKCIPIECSGFHAAWMNAVESMQRGEMHPYWTQCKPCSVAKRIPIECSGY